MINEHMENHSSTQEACEKTMGNHMVKSASSIFDTHLWTQAMIDECEHTVGSTRKWWVRSRITVIWPAQGADEKMLAFTDNVRCSVCEPTVNLPWRVRQIRISRLLAQRRKLSWLETSWWLATERPPFGDIASHVVEANRRPADCRAWDASIRYVVNSIVDVGSTLPR